MGKHVGFRYTLQWYSPYTDPPAGQSRIKAEAFETIAQRKKRGTNTVPEEIRNLFVPGSGYSIYIQAVCKPTKVRNKKALASIRTKKVTARNAKKYPMFAEEFTGSDIAKKPDYYAGETDPKIEQLRKEALDEEEELYQRYLEATK